MPDIVTATDGSTSIPATRQITSSTDFVASGVNINDILHIEDGTDTGDNDRYYITTVTTNILTVHKDWPVGSLSNLTFRVQQVDQDFVGNADYLNLRRLDRDAHRHRMTPVEWLVLDQLTEPQRNIYGDPISNDFTYNALSSYIPLHVRLNPPVDDLTKYGIDTPRDALFVMSKALADDYSFTPKIGDRFNYYSENVLQQFEVLSLHRIDINGNMSTGLHYVGTANKPEDLY